MSKYTPDRKVVFGALAALTTSLVLWAGAKADKQLDAAMTGSLVTGAYALAAYLVPSKYRRAVDQAEEIAAILAQSNPQLNEAAVAEQLASPQRTAELIESRQAVERLEGPGNVTIR